MSESIKVVCRVRPLNESEIAKGSKYVVNFPNDSSGGAIQLGVSFVIWEPFDWIQWMADTYCDFFNWYLIW